MTILTTHAKRRRIIVNTDAKNEADDQFAIVQALLSPSLDVRGIIPAHFGTRRNDHSLQESREEVDLLLRLLGMTGQVRVENGAPTAIPSELEGVDSPGARLIIEESLLASEDDKLYVTFLGPLTDMASAILLDPELASRPVVVVWIGGFPYRDFERGTAVEFNLSNDIAAANVVFASGIEIWQVPCDVYSQMNVGYAELEDRIGGTSELADYLIQQLVEHNTDLVPHPIEARSLGDNPAIGLVLAPWAGRFRTVPACHFSQDGLYQGGSGHPVRWVEQVDSRYILEDMIAKIRRFGS